MRDQTLMKRMKTLILRHQNFNKDKVTNYFLSAMKYRYSKCQISIIDNDLICVIKYVSKDETLDQHFEKNASDFFLRMIIKYEM